MTSSNALFITLFSPLIAFAFTACEPADSGEVTDVQEVKISITDEGFDPVRLELEAGVRARLTFTRESGTSCATSVKIPALDVAETDLPLNEPVTITITPEEGGSYTFTCGMDMKLGTIIVES